MKVTACPLLRTFWPTVLLLLLAGVVFECTSLDIWIQDHFYHFDTHRWAVDGGDAWYRLVFYQSPKVLLIIFALLAFVFSLGPARWLRAWGLTVSHPRLRLGVVILSLATGPALIGYGKSVSNVFCPSELQRYGGDVPYVRVFQAYSPEQKPNRRGRCFPAGHASGGFALMSTAVLACMRRGQVRGVLIGFAAGTVMGAYQMLKGAHFLSHTVTTALLCWLVVLFWVALAQKIERDKEEPKAES